MADALEDQRRRSNAWRAVVSITLRACGITEAEARPAARRTLDEAFGIEPDVYGVPGLHIVASPVAWARVSTYLTKAIRDADERGQGDIPVLVIPRQLHEPGDAYAVLRLADFAQLALDAHRGRSDAGEG